MSWQILIVLWSISECCSAMCKCSYDIQMGVHDPYEDCVSVMRLYKRMRDQDHLKDFIGACLPSHVTEFLTNEFEYCKMKDLEKLTPDELYEMSRSKYRCWCLDLLQKVRP